MQSAGYDLCLVGKSGDPLQIGSKRHKIRYHDAEKERVLAERVPHLQAEKENSRQELERKHKQAHVRVSEGVTQKSVIKRSTL